MDASHVIKFQIVRSIKLSQALQDTWFDVRMISAFAFAETMWSWTGFGFQQTWKTFARIEIEVLLCYNTLQSQEILNSAHFVTVSKMETQLQFMLGEKYWLNIRGINNQSFATDKEKLVQAEVLQPPLKVFCIDPDFDGSPRGVNDTGRTIWKNQFFELFHVFLFAGRLRVIGNRACDWITYHNQKSVNREPNQFKVYCWDNVFSGYPLCAWIHVMNALWHFAVDEVAWRFLHCNLPFDCRWHMVAIPVKTAAVVSIEEMDFAAGRSDIRMQSDEFKQCTRSTLFDANN